MTPKPSPTLDTLAEQAQLHKATISRILSGTYNGSAATKKRVLDLAAELDYAPNLLARAVRQQALPVLLAVAGPDPYSTAYLRMLGLEFKETDLDLLISYEQQDYTLTLEHLRPAAAVIFGPRYSEAQARLFDRPDVIAVNCQLPKARFSCFRVDVDFRQGFRDMATQLHALGHRRILYVGPCRDYIVRYMKQREQAARDRFGKLEPGTEFEVLSYGDPKALEVALAERLEQPLRPTACLCASDGLALRCLAVAARLGLRVPDDLSITGCDGIAVRGEGPDITTLHVPHGAIARTIRSWVTDIIYPAKTGKQNIEPQMLPVALELWAGTTAGPAS